MVSAAAQQAFLLLVLISESFVSGFHSLHLQRIIRSTRSLHNANSLCFGAPLSMRSNNNNNEERSAGLRKALETVKEVGGTSSAIKVGSIVVAGNNIPSLGIWQYQSYELMSIYDRGINQETGAVEKLTKVSLQEPEPPCYTRYVSLYSDKHHKTSPFDGHPVVVSPNEVELSSMQAEVVDSVVMALPFLGFWTALAYSFASRYSERTGGTFFDAFFGR